MFKVLYIVSNITSNIAVVVVVVVVDCPRPLLAPSRATPMSTTLLGIRVSWISLCGRRWEKQ